MKILILMLAWGLIGCNTLTTKLEEPFNLPETESVQISRQQDLVLRELTTHLLISGRFLVAGPIKELDHSEKYGQVRLRSVTTNQLAGDGQLFYVRLEDEVQVGDKVEIIPVEVYRQGRPLTGLRFLAVPLPP